MPELCVFFGKVALVVGLFLSAVIEFNIQDPIVRIPEEFKKVIVAWHKNSENLKIQVGIAGQLHCQEMFLFLLVQLVVREHIGNPIPVEVVEDMAIYALHCKFFYNLKLLDWYQDYMMCPNVYGNEDAKVFV